MRRWHKAVAATVICLAVIAVAGQQTTRLWHTSPDKWEEPRTFHSSFRAEIAESISVTHEKPSNTERAKALSPNKAYWFTVNTADTGAPRKDKDKFLVSAPDASIHVFTERERLTKITFKDHYPNFALDVRWINEKLLYIEVWWGRVVGSCFIFDVEHEQFIYKEMVHDGLIPFQQFRQAREKGLQP